MDARHLVYLMGPSGAGKDSVLQYARDRIGGRYDVVVAHRYITRPAAAGHENYISLSRDEFALRRRKGLFALDWEARGVRYAVGVEINLWLAAGLVVVVSGSRAHFHCAADSLPGVTPVAITAPVEVLRQRLLARGREGAAEIDQRVARAAQIAATHPALVEIDNSGPLPVAGDRLLRLLAAAAGASVPAPATLQS